MLLILKRKKTKLKNVFLRLTLRVVRCASIETGDGQLLGNVFEVLSNLDGQLPGRSQHQNLQTDVGFTKLQPCCKNIGNMEKVFVFIDPESLGIFSLG